MRAASGATESHVIRGKLARTARIAVTASMLTGLLSGIVVAVTATTAAAAQAVQCIDPASGGSSTTFVEGTPAEYNVECEEETGISGTSAYPTIAINTGAFPADANQYFPTYTTGTAPTSCSHATSGSGASEFYIDECELQASTTSADASGSPYPFTFTATPGPFTGSTLTSANSGTLSVAVAAPTVTCVDPASGGSSVTFPEGTAAEYNVECESQSGISGVTAYPSAIAVATGGLPTDANQFLPTYTTGTAPSSCTHGTSGSGATEEYILECELQATTTSADASGSPYPFTFTATGPGGYGTGTSGTLTVNVAPATLACIDPASGGSSTTFYSSTGGNSNSYNVECYGESGISGVSAYPSSIAIATQNPALPGDVTFGSGCTTTTSGSGATEEYILECPLAESSTTADDGSYAVTFTATGPGGNGSVTSGTLNLSVSPPTTSCSLPASGGTTESWVVGTAESATLDCYSQGFTTLAPGNYPTSITLATGAVPSDASYPTTTPGCTQATSGSGVTEEYELECKITETPTYSDIGTYHATFLATAGSSGATNTTSGTLTINITQPAPTWVSGQYFSAIKGVTFCQDVAVSNAGALPLTSITAGATPSGFTNYGVQNVNLAAGTAQVCGTDTNTPGTSGAPPTVAPVATNTGGSATDNIPTFSQTECTWVTSTGTVNMFDPNQDLETVGTQSAFGQPITNGETAGVTTNEPTCPNDVGVAGQGGLGDAWTVNTANPLPTPVDTNPSAAQGDLPSSNLDLGKGCYGALNLLASDSYTTMGSSYKLTMPSPWVNGGDCSYGTLGSNSAGGNTDTVNASCPPSQADVNAGYVDCTSVDSSGNDENGSVNYTSLDEFFNGQPVPQQSTATLSSPGAIVGGSVSVTGGSNWWGSSGGAPNTGPYGDTQSGAFYQVSAPGVFIGTSRATAVPVVDSTVTISPNTYVCTGAESTTVGPNPCTLTPGQPTGTFQVPFGLSSGNYNVYIDESNTTPLVGNGPNDAYQTARGSNLGTAESVTPVTVSAAGSSTTTTPGSTSIVLGNSNSDSATVTGGANVDPTGTVNFYECGPTATPTPCTSGSWTAFDTETLSGTSNPSTVGSAPFTPTSAGYWCFAGVYSGDNNYSTSADMSTDECFDVTPATSSTTTTPGSTSIVLGSSNTDSATVTANASGVTDPSGSVSFYECGPTATPTPCTAGSWTVFDTETLSGTSNPSTVGSASFTATSAGYWCFAGVYSGDGNYSGSSDMSTDECFDVTPATSSTTSTPGSSSIVLGSSDADSATVTGNATGVTDPSGSVAFYECGPTASPTPCTSGSWTQFDSESLAGGTNPSTVVSTDFTPTSVGTWCFAAIYGGDNNYSGSSDGSTDECFDVTQTTSSTATSPASSSILLGTTDVDVATITGDATGVDDPTGTVDFYECGPTASPAPCKSANWSMFDTESLGGSTNPTTVDSAAFTPDDTGYWCFAAVYSGDSDYSGSSDKTTAECFDVAASASSTASTPLHSSSVLGNNNKDSAVVTGNPAGGPPTGTVTFYECGPTPSPTPCTSLVNQVGSTVSLSASGSDTSGAQSSSFTPNAVGYWCFAAVYSGDSNYAGSSDETVGECFDVTPAASTTNGVPATSKISYGGSDSDNATVTGNGPGGAPLGSVTFYECGPTSKAAPCTSTAQSVGTVTLTPGPGDVSYASSPAFTPSAGVGFYCFGVDYSGGTDYQPSADTSTTDCFHAVNAPPTITSFNPTVGRVGDSVTIVGTNLSGATVVKFNGTVAVIVSDTATKIKTTVPVGATTGKIEVATQSGSVKSHSKYTVIR